MFRHRLHLLSVGGIKISVDASWLIIAILLSWSLAVGYFPYLCPGLTPDTYWLMGIIGMLSLFVCILLHEMGHAFVAKHYSLPVNDITLFIFGGVAEIKKDPPSPKIEFLVSIAGPIVSIVLSLIMYFLTMLAEQGHWPKSIEAITYYLFFINLILVAFNMIPAMPLDGGRVFRAFLWWCKNDSAWATRVTSFIGVAFGYVLVFLGFYLLLTVSFLSGLWLIIIGLFLQGAASSSRTQLYLEKELRNQQVAKFMTLDPISVSPKMTVKDFIEQYVYQSLHHLYPVASDETLVGYISTKEVRYIPHEAWATTLVEQAMVPRNKFAAVQPTTGALEALSLMNQTDAQTLIVVDQERLVGIVTAHTLLKIISLKMELEQ